MRLPTVCIAALLSLTGCTSAVDVGDDPSATGALNPTDSCTATLHYLQKDAYANHAGRSSELWPPHTTTTVEIVCGEETPIVAVRENHGTKPTDLDADKKPILVETATEGPIETTRERATALLAAYKACECAPSVPFLSLEALDQDKAKQLFASLGAYVSEHLSCDDDFTDVAGFIIEGKVDEALVALAACEWDSGQSWADGFESATATVLGKEKDGFHVCNNDAQLEADLFHRFAAGGEITACLSDSAVCHGPKWFYEP